MRTEGRVRTRLARAVGRNKKKYEATIFLASLHWTTRVGQRDACFGGGQATKRNRWGASSLKCQKEDLRPHPHLCCLQTANSTGNSRNIIDDVRGGLCTASGCGPAVRMEVDHFSVHGRLGHEVVVSVVCRHRHLFGVQRRTQIQIACTISVLWLIFVLCGSPDVRGHRWSHTKNKYVGCVKCNTVGVQPTCRCALSKQKQTKQAVNMWLHGQKCQSNDTA